MHFHTYLGATCKAATRSVVAAAITPLAISLAAGPALAVDTWVMLSGTPNPSVHGQSVEFTATVYGSGPAGNVTFMDGATSLGAGALEIHGVGETISAGAGHSCAITVAGGAMCWGDNADGQLGNGASGTTENAPVAVIGLSSGVVEIETGKDFTCALTDAGAVKCWGENYAGELGNGTTSHSSIPVQVTGLASGVVAIAVGYEHACALTDAGAMKCWGENDYGQLGDNSGLARSTPVDPIGLSSGIAAIGAGGHTTCAVTDAGAAKCWGYNAHGQVGDDSRAYRYAPVDVVGLMSGVERIAVGTSHTCAQTTAGAAQCWGSNSNGQLGDGTNTDHIVPAPVSGLASGVADIDAGDRHVCAVTDAGEVLCWGSNSNDQLGSNGGGDQYVPGTVVNGATNGALVDAGWYHSCVLTINGSAKCWGNNNHGEIGDGSYTDRMTPVTVSGFGANTSMVPGRTALSSDSLTTGVHTMTAAYEGDTDNVASTSPAFTHTVNKGETLVEKIKFKPKKPKAGQTVKITATIDAVDPAVGIPDGKAVIKDGNKKLGKFAVKNGKAKIKVSDLKSGKHKIKVKYKGADDWEKSDDKKTLNVKSSR